MKLSKTWKYIIGLATAWVTIYPLLFFLVWLSFPLAIMAGGLLAEFLSEDFLPLFGIFPILFFAIFPLHFLTIFLMLGLSPFYLAHVIKNQEGSDTVRIILGVGSFYMPFIAMPIYYFTYIWRDEPPEWAKAK